MTTAEKNKKIQICGAKQFVSNKKRLADEALLAETRHPARLNHKNFIKMFNNKFYKPNKEYTREMAEARLMDLGYKNFTFKSVSYTYGASFYFESEDGEELRVSDHSLTGKRAFYCVQILFEEPKVMVSPIRIRAKYLSGEISKKEYKAICKEKGFIYKP